MILIGISRSSAPYMLLLGPLHIVNHSVVSAKRHRALTMRARVFLRGAPG
jgi:hypothetical protein